eukprot:2845767-Amphidinium_carterae.1
MLRVSQEHCVWVHALLEAVVCWDFENYPQQMNMLAISIVGMMGPIAFYAQVKCSQQAHFRDPSKLKKADKMSERFKDKWKADLYVRFRFKS